MGGTSWRSPKGPRAPVTVRRSFLRRAVEALLQEVGRGGAATSPLPDVASFTDCQLRSGRASETTSHPRLAVSSPKFRTELAVRAQRASVSVALQTVTSSFDRGSKVPPFVKIVGGVVDAAAPRSEGRSERFSGCRRRRMSQDKAQPLFLRLMLKVPSREEAVGTDSERPQLRAEVPAVQVPEKPGSTFRVSRSPRREAEIRR